jgi:hypothetical protein
MIKRHEVSAAEWSLTKASTISSTVSWLKHLSMTSSLEHHKWQDVIDQGYCFQKPFEHEDLCRNIHKPSLFSVYE